MSAITASMTIQAKSNGSSRDSANRESTFERKQKKRETQHMAQQASRQARHNATGTTKVST